MAVSFFTVALLIFGNMCCMFFIGLKTRDNSLVDIAYGPASVFCLLGNPVFQWGIKSLHRPILFLVLLTFWGAPGGPLACFGEATLWPGSTMRPVWLDQHTGHRFYAPQSLGNPHFRGRVSGKSGMSSLQGKNQRFFPWFEPKTTRKRRRS
jgi:hypothetical protein